MLVIRLQRTGRENLPTYRVVVAEKRAPAKGKFQEILGHYLPAREPTVLEVNEERVSFWIGRGAAPSNTLARLLKKRGMKDMEKFITSYTKKRSKNETPPPAHADASAAEVPAAAQADVAEAPAAEPEAPASDSGTAEMA